MSEFYQKLLRGNRNWVESVLKQNPNYFKKLAEGQKPPVLWIGCSDSRVAANVITDTQPGEIFVHRNIANQVVHTDMNLLSVLDYAVNYLEVEHVIVCGHYNCGGVLAAMSQQQLGIIDNWLRHIKDVYRLYQEELEAVKNEEERIRRFHEFNVIEQVYNLSKTSIIQNAWKKRNQPKIHGWIYNVADGLIKDLHATLEDDSQIISVYRIG